MRCLRQKQRKASSKRTLDITRISGKLVMHLATSGMVLRGGTHPLFTIWKSRGGPLFDSRVVVWLRQQGASSSYLKLASSRSRTRRLRF